jgi:formamidopyrimidine-DNA glycosylase
MPELPEVEFARRALLRWMEGRRVVAAEAEPTRVFRGARPSEQLSDFGQLRGRLQGLERRGKYLLFTFEGGRGLLGHLGMTGKFVRRPAGHAEPYSRARFQLDSGDVVHFRDPRLFGRMEPAPAAQLHALPAVKALGLDPLLDGAKGPGTPLTGAQLQQALGSSKQDLKVALMDQERIAGLGNIHAAEALFRAGLHPSRKPASLTPAEWTRLARSIQATLDFAFKLNGEGDEMDYLEEPGAKNPFRIYGRAGEACSKCRTRVESFAQGGRTTHFCPHCQPRP